MIKILELFGGIGSPRKTLIILGIEHKCIKGKLNGTLYKQAGNSIVVQVLEAIFKELLRSEIK